MSDEKIVTGVGILCVDEGVEIDVYVEERVLDES